MTTIDFRTLVRFDAQHMADRIPAGPFFLSAQASRSHYCDPRVNLSDPMDYATWEAAVFDADGGWVSKERLAVIGVSVPTLGRWERGSCPVGGGIPTAEMQALFSLLCAYTERRVCGHLIFADECDFHGAALAAAKGAT